MPSSRMQLVQGGQWQQPQNCRREGLNATLLLISCLWFSLHCISLGHFIGQLSAGAIRSKQCRYPPWLASAPPLNVVPGRVLPPPEPTNPAPPSKGFLVGSRLAANELWLDSGLAPRALPQHLCCHMGCQRQWQYGRPSLRDFLPTVPPPPVSPYQGDSSRPLAMASCGPGVE